MISIIICSITPEKFVWVSSNFSTILGSVPYEIIGIHDAKSLTEGYNRGAAQSRGSILIFCHDDIEIITPDFYPRICQYLKIYDVVGCAGTSRLIDSRWAHAGDPFVHGIVAYPATDNWPSDRFNLVMFGGVRSVVVEGIQALDGFFFAVNRRVLDVVHFDEQNFDGFHCYDTDFTFAAYLSGFRLAVCKDILIAHKSNGDYGEGYTIMGTRFMKKYQRHLPAQAHNKYHMALAKNLDRTQMLSLCK